MNSAEPAGVVLVASDSDSGSAFASASSVVVETELAASSGSFGSSSSTVLGILSVVGFAQSSALVEDSVLPFALVLGLGLGFVSSRVLLDSVGIVQFAL